VPLAGAAAWLLAARAQQAGRAPFESASSVIV
jgi:hypothetical protein